MFRIQAESRPARVQPILGIALIQFRHANAGGASLPGDVLMLFSVMVFAGFTVLSKGAIAEFGSLAAYFWRFEPVALPVPAGLGDIPPHTEVSARISKDLRKRGWSFVGPTTVYAFMQAMGLVNDHVAGCFCRAEVDADRARFVKPGR